MEGVVLTLVFFFQCVIVSSILLTHEWFVACGRWMVGLRVWLSVVWMNGKKGEFWGDGFVVLCFWVIDLSPFLCVCSFSNVSLFVFVFSTILLWCIDSLCFLPWIIVCWCWNIRHERSWTGTFHFTCFLHWMLFCWLAWFTCCTEQFYLLWWRIRVW